jgi:hypothetical protein
MSSWRELTAYSLTSFAGPLSDGRIPVATLVSNPASTQDHRPSSTDWLISPKWLFWVTLGAPGCKTGGLKIRVSGVRFSPWPPFSSTSIAVALLAEPMLRHGSAFARAQRGHPPDQAVEARSVFFRESLLERLDQHVRVLRLERQRRANLEYIAVAAG